MRVCWSVVATSRAAAAVRMSSTDAHELRDGDRGQRGGHAHRKEQLDKRECRHGPHARYCCVAGSGFEPTVSWARSFRKLFSPMP